MENESNTNSSIMITDFIPESSLQKMQDTLAVSTGMAVHIENESGAPITEATPKRGICNNCICNSLGECLKRSDECCDLFEGDDEKGLPKYYRCKAGLILMAAPVIADGEVLCNVLCGQVLPEEQGRYTFRNLDIELVRALNNTLKMDRTELKKMGMSLKTMTDGLSDIAQRAYLIERTVNEAANASKVKGDFLANMSHEIRTPMNAVLGMVDMALREDMPAAAREYVSQIKVSGKNLLAIINDILDFSKIESGKMEIVPENYQIYSVINDVSNIICMRIGDKEIEFTMDISPDIPKVLYGDGNHIHEVLINVLNNAVKFTRKGNIKLSMYCEPGENDDVTLCIDISDTGIGIKDEDKHKLFESFQQVDTRRNRNIEGTGLGLAITKQLLALMGGTITFESEHKVGTTFYIRLPQKAVQRMPSLPLLEKKQRVYLYIANEYVRAQMISDLERVNAECRVIDDLSCIESERPDLLITDKDELTSELLCFYEKTPGLRCLALVGHTSNTSAILPNVRSVKKPVCSRVLYNAMGLSDIELFSDDAMPDETKFVAPTANVLIVDDNTVNLTVAKGLLQPLKMSIDLAENAGEAIEKIMEKEYDIIFMDHMMPEVDGVEATHMIRRIMPEYDDIPIIALTANAVSGAKEMFLAEGMADFVAKPIDFKKISYVLYKWLPKDKIVPVSDDEDILPEPADNNAGEFSIPGLDTANAISGLGGKELYMTVLNEYFKSITPKSETIRKHFESGDIKNYTIEVHSLKSTSRQIGAMELGELAYSLEMAGKNGDMELINAKTDEVLKMYTDLKDVLRPYVTVEENTELKEVSKDDVLSLFDSLSEAMSSFDAIEIDELIGRLSEYDFKSDSQKEYLEEIKSAAETMDFDTIESTIEKWRQELQ